MTIKQYLSAKNMAAATIKRHEQEIQKYDMYLSDYRSTIAESANKKDVLSYLSYLKTERQLSNSTQNQVLGILRNYYSYLSEYQEIQDITKLFKIRGVHRQELRPIFTQESLQDLCQVYLDTHGETGSYIALTLLTNQGLQTGELLSLSADDFDLRKATVYIAESKRGAARKLQLNATQMLSLIAYFGNGNMRILDNYNQLYRIGLVLKKLTKTSDTVFLDFRQLRSSCITNWISNVGLRKAQYLSGHRNIRNTEQYSGNHFKTLQEQVDLYHPLQ